MKKISSLVMAFMMFGVFNVTHAQIRKIPAEVTEGFKEKYPDTKNVEWKDKLSAFQVTYEMGDVKYTSKFSSKGEWLQTEKEIEEDALPAAVKDGYSKSKFTAWELKSVSSIESNSNDIQYRLFVRKSGVEKKYLYFDKDGKLIKDSITI
ncbi:MAG: PepSY-like domain-containing protein [Bacteroidota bacterium]